MTKSMQTCSVAQWALLWELPCCCLYLEYKPSYLLVLHGVEIHGWSNKMQLEIAIGFNFDSNNMLRFNCHACLILKISNVSSSSIWEMKLFVKHIMWSVTNCLFQDKILLNNKCLQF